MKQSSQTEAKYFFKFSFPKKNISRTTEKLFL